VTKITLEAGPARGVVEMIGFEYHLGPVSKKTIPNLPNYWPLQDAKSRFSELVRRVKRDGPQHVTLRGREEVVVISAAEFRRLKGNQSGEALIEALQSSPYREVSIEVPRMAMPIRDLEL